MRIKLLSLELKNFKGVKEQLINFDGFSKQISGDNGTGKTSIFDAFCWLMFGKNSLGESKFEIQTLDENNNIIHNLEHSITGILEIDGVSKTFKRTLKEKWQKKKGQAEQELTGTNTIYEIDDIPIKQKDYLEKINEILNESSFKLLTNPLYFPNLNWKEQRTILMDIIGDIEAENVINYNTSLKPLLDMLEGKNIEEFNEKVKASIKKLKDKVKDIPARIDENNSMICNEDFEELEKEKIILQNKINDIDSQIADASKANEGKIKLQEQLFKLKDQLNALRNEAARNANKPLNEIQENINKVKAEIQEINFKIKDTERKRDNFCDLNLSTERELEKLNIKRQTMLKEFHKANDEEFNFDEKETVCKCCGRPFEMEKIEEIKEAAKVRFDENKKHNTNEIKQSGLNLKAVIEKAENLLVKNKEEINKLTDEILKLESQVTESEKELENLENQKQKIDCVEPVIEGEKELISQIEAIQGQISNFKSNDNTELKEEKRTLQGRLSSIERVLGKQQTNEDIKIRISELSQELKDLNIQIAALEKQQFLGEEFIRTKVELLEGTINRKFKGEVSFKLFKNQVNGGLEETCEALINGVPFGDANKAAKMNVGLSILNTLCEHYNTYCPVFIDNAESVNKVKETESQLILLKVSKDKNMKVEVIE